MRRTVVLQLFLDAVSGKARLLVVICYSAQEGSKHPMEQERGTKVARLFDDGGPFDVEVQGAGGTGPSYVAIATRFCVEPSCAWREMILLVQRMESLDDERLRPVASREDAVTFNVDTSEFSVCDGPGGVERSEATIELLRRSLNSDHRAFLRARFHRAKAQRTEEWQKLDFSTIDVSAMVPYFQLAPVDWTLRTVHEGKHYWLIDYW